ncbi:hypothetical protein FALBO_14239 [Fusarium albosuccineum]|uniref:Uncharacterized protein n=1 Tax=Fusarium albosuccineum TaxID=1237068 RepID=A0A8H4KXB2_9HYPO|nr:hypothetical protein FALBO_14239 [Fusarium albosuccineum]
MSSSTMIAPFAVHQATTDIEKQIEFYKGIEFVVDDGWEPVEAIPETYWEARGMSGKDLKRTVAMKLPADPYMHLVLYEWSNLKTTPGWPCQFNQIGSRGISLLVEDVAAELSRIRKDWPQIRILQDPISIRRKWGHTTSALVLDPEHVFLELISIEKGSSFDPSNVKAPTSCDRVWLHFMHMCTNFHITEPFYKSFGMEHDHGVDFRPKSGFHPFSFEHFNQQMKDAFGYDMTLRPSSGPTVSFLRTERDCSQMHIELHCVQN